MSLGPAPLEATKPDGAARAALRPPSSIIPGSSRNAYWLYLMPGLALLTIIIVVPLLWNIYLTFTDYRGIRPPEWIGLDNWVELFGDAVFWTSFGNSIAMIVAMVVVPTLLGLLLAAMLFDLIGKTFGGRIASFLRATY
jgi:raffinose/stachyose/melibiose transport system permease protein